MDRQLTLGIAALKRLERQAPWCPGPTRWTSGT
jgi:hypothetical protein